MADRSGGGGVSKDPVLKSPVESPYGNSPTFTVRVDQVFVDPGKSFSVFLRGKDGVCQLELRVLPDGTPEVWLSEAEDKVHVRQWETKEWTPMPDSDGA